MHHQSTSQEDIGMTEPAPAPQFQEPQAGAAEPAGEAHPWGDDFDPARAWHTIQSLREREKELSKTPRLTPEKQQQLEDYNRLVEASKTDAERLQERAQTATREAENARAEAIRYKAAATHGISADHFDLLGSGTEEEVTARAQKIAALISAQTQPAPPAPVAPQRRPVEQMRPGATPGGTESEDDVLYGALFGTK